MSNIIDSIRLSGTTYQIQGEITVDAALDSGSTNPVENKAIYNKFDEVEQVTAAALNELNDAISGKVDTSTYNTYTAATDTALNGKQPTLVSGTNIKTINNQSILGSGNIDIQGGGKAIEAGRGITITTGETADTVSFNLPISAGTGSDSIAEGNSTIANGQASHAEGQSTSANSYSHSEGYYTKANGTSSHAEGGNTQANGNSSHAEGSGTRANNWAEHASGQYNNSVSASTTFGDSGNTLFSVGNGTSTSARHNAFEIRQNGDIYISSGNTDIKLQDHLGGGSVTVDSALSPTSENPVQNKAIYNKIDEVEQVTAAGLNAVNDKFDGLRLKKLTQTEYNNLQTKDPSTLYVIVD